MAKINVSKLHGELVNAGIEISGCDSSGVVLNLSGDQIQDRKDVIAVIAAHDPAPDQETILHQKYADVGVTSPTMIFALWKKVMNADPTDADALQLLIDQVNSSMG